MIEDKTKQNENDFLRKLVDFKQHFIEPDSVKQALLTLHNQQFCNGIGSYGTAISLTHQKLFEKIHFIEYGKHLKPIESCLAQIFIGFIHDTQQLMVYLSPDEGLEFAQRRIPYILKKLQVYYRYFYKGENPSEEFLDELDKFIYHVIALNYQREIVLTRDSESMLEVAYQSFSQLAFQSIIYTRGHLYIEEIRAQHFIGQDKIAEITRKVHAHNEGIVQRYRKNTVQVTPPTGPRYVLMSLLLLLALYLYLVGQFIIATMLTVPTVFTMVYPFIRRTSMRKFTDTYEAEYTKTAIENLYSLERSKGFKGVAQTLRAQITEADAALKKAARLPSIQQKTNRASALDKKHQALFEARRLYLMLNYSLKKLKKPKVKPSLPVAIEKLGKVERSEAVDDTRVVFCSFPDNPDSDLYDLRALKRCYVNRREREAARETQKALPQNSPAKMAKVFYRLDPALQAHACLVIEDDSKMIFDLGDQVGDLTDQERDKFLANEYRVVPKTGQFGGFKFLSPGKYELKFPSSNVRENKKLRFFFAREGHKEIDGVNIPYYRVTATGGK